VITFPDPFLRGAFSNAAPAGRLFSSAAAGAIQFCCCGCQGGGAGPLTFSGAAGDSSHPLDTLPTPPTRTLSPQPNQPSTLDSQPTSTPPSLHPYPAPKPQATTLNPTPPTPTPPQASAGIQWVTWSTPSAPPTARSHPPPTTPTRPRAPPRCSRTAQPPPPPARRLSACSPGSRPRRGSPARRWTRRAARMGSTWTDGIGGRCRTRCGGTCRSGT